MHFRPPSPLARGLSQPSKGRRPDLKFDQPRVVSSLGQPRNPRVACHFFKFKLCVYARSPFKLAYMHTRRERKNPLSRVVLFQPLRVAAAPWAATHLASSPFLRLIFEGSNTSQRAEISRSTKTPLTRFDKRGGAIQSPSARSPAASTVGERLRSLTVRPIATVVLTCFACQASQLSNPLQHQCIDVEKSL